MGDINVQSEKVNLMDLLSGKSKLGEIDKIIIPDVQRDYVLGSGGEKLVRLFKEMNKHNEGFNFSCIMGYKDSSTKILYIYDGQQRIVTLMYLAAYLSDIGENDKYIEQIRKFLFTERESANQYLISLIEGKKTDIYIEDYTTFSIKNLIDEFKQQKYVDQKIKVNNINIKFLMEKVYFEVVPVKRATDAEQFFMDLNDGLDLKEYEIYKAELYHKAKNILRENFKRFTLSMENEWLVFFQHLVMEQGEECCAEEVEILFIKFCFYMMWVEEERNSDGFNENDLEWIEISHLNKLEQIVNNLIKIKFNNQEYSCINYSLRIPNNKCKRHIESVQGVFWNLNNNQYVSMLNIFLKSFYENCKDEDGNKYIKIKEQAKYDAVIWAYISSLDMSIKEQQDHLRYIKILLNRNTIENNKAFYSNSDKVWYTQYSTYGIPTYYTKQVNSFAAFNLYEKQCNEYLKDVIILNKHFKGCLDIIDSFQIKNCKLGILVDEIRDRYNKLSAEDYEKFKQIENLSFINGFVDNLIDDDGILMVDSKTLREKIGIEEKSLDEKKIISKLLNEFSYLGVNNSESYLFKKISYIFWIAYTNNVSNYSDIELPLQTITDLFINKHFKELIQVWLCVGKNEITKPINDKLFYLRAYQHIPIKGWRVEDYEIVYVNNYYDDNNTNRGLASSRANVHNPYTKHNIKDYIHRLKIDSRLSECDVEIMQSIKRQINGEWLPQRLQENEIYYCEKEWMYFVILDEYVRKNLSNLNDIREMAINNQVIIRKCYDKIFYIPNEMLRTYINCHSR